MQQQMPGNGQSLGIAKVTMPCKVYPGMFDREYQVMLEIPGLGKVALFASASLIDTKGETPTPGGVAGMISVDVVAAEGDQIILELPGDTIQFGPRVQVPATFVQQLA